jgi:hypothetical protein
MEDGPTRGSRIEDRGSKMAIRSVTSDLWLLIYRSAILHLRSSILDLLFSIFHPRRFPYSLHARCRETQRLDDFVQVIVELGVMIPIDD